MVLSKSLLNYLYMPYGKCFKALNFKKGSFEKRVAWGFGSFGHIWFFFSRPKIFSTIEIHELLTLNKM